MNDVPGFGPNCRSIRYDTNFGSLPRANGSFRSMYKIPRYFLPFAAKDVSRVILLRTFVEKRTRLSRLSSCHRRWWLNKPRQALPLTTSHCTSKVSHSSITSTVSAVGTESSVNRVLVDGGIDRLIFVFRVCSRRVSFSRHSWLMSGTPPKEALLHDFRRDCTPSIGRVIFCCFGVSVYIN